ncbi:MAG: 2-C-methyl-D-erythritol 4-phosphate cytidylyltransferase [Candidatus Eisenbacteria bacterium]
MAATPADPKPRANHSAKPTPDLAVILAGAGEGRRMGDYGPKLLIDVGGRPALVRVAETFLAHPATGELVVTVPVELEAEAVNALTRVANPRGVRVSIIPGGETRQESVALAIEALTIDLPFIAVHDVARVLVDAPLIDRVLSAAREHGAAIPALPLTDTIKEIVTGPGDDRIGRSVPREQLVAAQTPQIFASDILRRAHTHARETRAAATDEAGLAAAIGVPVSVVLGDERNRKLTVPSDLIILNALLRAGAAGEKQ